MVTPRGVRIDVTGPSLHVDGAIAALPNAKANARSSSGGSVSLAAPIGHAAGAADAVAASSPRRRSRQRSIIWEQPERTHAGVGAAAVVVGGVAAQATAWTQRRRRGAAVTNVPVAPGQSGEDVVDERRRQW